MLLPEYKIKGSEQYFLENEVLRADEQLGLGFFDV